MDALTQRAIGPAVRLLCQIRLVVLAFALVLALLDGVGWVGVFLVLLAAPFSFVPALNWETRGRVYARNGILLAGDTAVAVVALLPLAGSPLMAIYAAATAALWGLFAGLWLALVMAVPLCLYQVTAYDDGWRGFVTGAAGAGLTMIMAWTGTHLGRRLRRQAILSAELATARAEQAALAERLRLARDLHDTVAGDLAGLALTVHGLADRLDREGVAPDTLEVARGLSGAVRTVHEHTRRALGELRDDYDGLSGLLTDLARRWSERTGISAAVEVGPGVDGVAGERRVRHVRALATELLENVRKHADASRVDVTVTAVGGAVELVVADDGVGLGPRTPRAGRYGMRGVRERAQLCGGDATWAPGPDGGTVVRVVLATEPAGRAVRAEPARPGRTRRVRSGTVAEVA